MEQVAEPLLERLNGVQAELLPRDHPALHHLALKGLMLADHVDLAADQADVDWGPGDELRKVGHLHADGLQIAAEDGYASLVRESLAADSLALGNGLQLAKFVVLSEDLHPQA